MQSFHTGEAALGEKISLYYSNLSWLLNGVHSKFVFCNCIILQVFLSLAHIIKLPYFIGLRMVSSWSTEHLATANKNL